MILKVSDSHDDTVDMFWRLRRLAGAPARGLRGARLCASYVRLSAALL
jgi:hypothetical protein